jgi:hypothetical protein
MASFNDYQAMNPAMPGFMSMSQYGMPSPAVSPSDWLTNPSLPNPYAATPVAAPTGFGAVGPSAGFGDWFKNSGMLNQIDPKTGMQTQGWGGLALGGAQALGSLYMGMQQYKLAKDTLASNKAQFERNFDAQKTTTNSALEDRQRARVASNPGAYQSVGDYMNQNGVR